MRLFIFLSFILLSNTALAVKNSEFICHKYKVYNDNIYELLDVVNKDYTILNSEYDIFIKQNNSGKNISATKAHNEKKHTLDFTYFYNAKYDDLKYINHKISAVSSVSINGYIGSVAYVLDNQFIVHYDCEKLY